MKNSIIIIPTYNNPKTIRSVALDVVTYGYKLIIIDDGSEQKVEDLFIDKKNIYFVRHERNQGKGQAIITGIKKAQELGFEYAVSIDGDGQHLASEISKLLRKYTKNEIMIGVRNFDGKHVPNTSKFGRWLSNFLASWNTEQKITDSLSGFRIYPVNILALKMKTSRFDWEMEVLIRHAEEGGIINEVSIECYYPTPKERVSHFKKCSDTASIAWVHLQILPSKWPRFILEKIMRTKK
ncbi:glycosyltransferase family 2 protein [Sulfurimonas sp. SAG-AH-194-I05]|nr:glycosyltransferase family 2 protein [Sulfurimonas sp. SAG-AH-194-I05]MDF1874730.1 glycosyltransferase family 2 protein [Sulfurimonas sp. SAG-AH-194-I05]